LKHRGVNKKTKHEISMLKQFLKHISVKDITLMSDVHKDLFINNYSKSHYFEMKNFEIEYFYDFITTLSSNSLYTMIPMISINNNPDEPYLVLSNSILVSKHSDHRMIHHYIYAKYIKSLEDFNSDGLEDYTLVFKYKRIKLDINQITKNL